MKVPSGESADRPRLEGRYVRVSGTTGRETSLDAREAELHATATGTVARVFRDQASGLREDRLARFGAGWIRRMLTAHGTTIEILHPKAQGGREELPEDFIPLVTTFAGRLYGMRSATEHKRLLAESARCPSGSVR